ncbi:MAG: hypothetical protein ACYDBB_04365 [Armatimonadota bacterium]
MTTHTPLLAGAAEIDITPCAGVHLAGAISTYRPAKMVLDPLLTKALVLEADGRKLCIVSMDLCIVTCEYCDRIRQVAAERFGFDPEAVMVHATQTHTAPGLGHFMIDQDFTCIPGESKWIRGGEIEYSNLVVERTLEAIAQAHSQLQPVDIGVGSGVEARFTFNRRAVCRDGSIAMPWKGWQGGPCGPTNILYIEGPMDPEVGVLCLRSHELTPVAMLASYTAHPVHVFPKELISADWPGAWSDAIKARYGKCTPLVLNGPCGNINPWPPFDPDYVEDHQRAGHELAKMTQHVIETMDFSSDAVLDWRVKHLKIPFREFTPEQVAELQAYFAQYPEPRWANEARTEVEEEWMVNASIYSVYLQQQREGLFDYEIQVFRIGDAVFVGLPGEPFVESALRIKLNSPAKSTYVVHMINQYIGYIPIKEAVTRGGHEGHIRYWSKLVPEALDTIVDAAREMVAELFETAAVAQ